MILRNQIWQQPIESKFERYAMCQSPSIFGKYWVKTLWIKILSSQIEPFYHPRLIFCWFGQFQELINQFVWPSRFELNCLTATPNKFSGWKTLTLTYRLSTPKKCDLRTNTHRHCFFLSCWWLIARLADSLVQLGLIFTCSLSPYWATLSLSSVEPPVQGTALL